MTAKFPTLILLLTLSLYTVGQETAKTNLFLNGIYLENLNMTIPWNKDYRKITSVGNPIVDTLSNGVIKFKWNAVTILNGVTVNLSFHVSRFQRKKHVPFGVITFSGIIEGSDIERIKKYLTEYTNSKGSCDERKNGSACYWKINGCNVIVGQWKKGRHPSVSYFDIQKIFPKRNSIER